MRTMLHVTLAAMLAAPLAACSDAHGRNRTLEPFRTEAQFQSWLKAWQARAKRESAHEVQLEAAIALPSPPPAPVAMAAAADQVQVTGSRVTAAEESITNVQTQGVDEGGIVKRQGDHLIVLRRGRLFTLRVGGDRLDAIASVDAFGPGIDPSGTWYDEMLVSDGTVAVIGYSYARGGTEVGLFDLDARGGLRHRGTYQLTSNDYYSSRNYASRLIGRTLVFYTPLAISPHDDTPTLPAMRRWRDGSDPAAFRRILPAQRIYRGIATPDLHDTALHTVSVCDLGAREMDCRSTAVLGPASRQFYVSQDAVYVWTTASGRAAGPSASVFRMPLDGSAPSSLRAWGSPVDQMSFLERDGHLNVLVGSEGRGEGMWAAEARRGRPGLLRVPLVAFGDARAQASWRHYRLLDGELGYGAQNRFVGDWLLYGSGDGHPGAAPAFAVRYATREPAQPLMIRHGLDRIEAMGDDALLVGSRGDDLHFTSVALGAQAAVTSSYRQPDARQGESRTHGFFYRPSAPDAGLLGLPILRGDDAASVVYLRNRALELSPLGMLESGTGARRDDGCRASCVDWYGNARPLFIGDRVFALMGYELVEGRVDAGRIGERRRIDFTPAVAIAH